MGYYLAINQARATPKNTKPKTKTISHFNCDCRRRRRRPYWVCPLCSSTQLQLKAQIKNWNCRPKMQRRIERLTGRGWEEYRENIIILCLCRLCRLLVIKLQHCKMLMSCHDIRRDSQDSRDQRPETWDLTEATRSAETAICGTHSYWLRPITKQRKSPNCWLKATAKEGNEEEE